MRISTALWYRQGVNNMLENQSGLSKTQRQLATGRRILSPQDDPVGAVRSLKLDEALANVRQYQRNGERAAPRLQREEQVLASMTNNLQRVRELAVQGLNDTLTASDRDTIALELRQRLDGLLSLANEKDANGEYLFSGSRTDKVPFVDTGSGYSYQGDQTQRLAQLGENSFVATNDPGDKLFMSIDDGSGGTTDLFSIVRKLADDMDAGTPAEQSLTQIDNAIARLDQARARIGSRRNTIDAQRQAQDTFSLVIQKDLSDLRDLDYAKAVSRLQQQMLSLQASQKTFMKIEGLSLFNYL